MAVVGETFFVGIANGQEGGDLSVFGQAEDFLYLSGVETEHGRGIEAIGAGSKQQIAQEDVALTCTPGFAFLVGALGPVLAEAIGPGRFLIFGEVGVQDFFGVLEAVLEVGVKHQNRRGRGDLALVESSFLQFGFEFGGFHYYDAPGLEVVGAGSLERGLEDFLEKFPWDRLLLVLADAAAGVGGFFNAEDFLCSRTHTQILYNS